MKNYESRIKRIQEIIGHKESSRLIVSESFFEPFVESLPDDDIVKLSEMFKCINKGSEENPDYDLSKITEDEIRILNSLPVI